MAALDSTAELAKLLETWDTLESSGADVCDTLGR